MVKYPSNLSLSYQIVLIFQSELLKNDPLFNFLFGHKTASWIRITMI